MLMLNFALHFRKCINIVIQFYLSTPIPNQTFDNSFAIIFFFNFNRCQCNCTKHRPPFTRLHSFLLSQVSEFRNFDRWSCCEMFCTTFRVRCQVAETPSRSRTPTINGQALTTSCILYFGAKHMPLFSHRPFHFHCSIGTLLLC